MAGFLLSNLSAITYAGIFIIGLFIKSPLQKSKDNSVLDTVAKDRDIMKKLYDEQLEANERLKATYEQQSDVLRATQARLQSYENFLQTRTFETDKTLKQVPPFLKALAEKFEIELPEVSLQGSESAHSQLK